LPHNSEMESVPEENNQVPKNGKNHKGANGDSKYVFSTLDVLEAFGFTVFEVAGYALHEAEFQFVGYVLDFFGAWCGLLVVRHRMRYSKLESFASGFYWSLLVISFLFFAFLSWSVSLNKSEQSTKILENESETWQPPELPKDCKDVVLWFGGQGMIYKMEWLTNYPFPPGKTTVPISKFPESARTNFPNIPGFSPRLKGIWGFFEVSNRINGKNEDFYPVLPQVVSNRLYVFVKTPFTNYQRIVMSDEMDSILTNCLPQSPAYWDWNYSRNPKTNVFEIVNENKNPIVQVIYKSPREILVNGVFFVSHYDVQVTFEGKNPAFFSIPFVKTNVNVDLSGSISTNPPAIKKHAMPVSQYAFGTTNFIFSIAVEDVYAGFATNQKPIFKYPSNVFPGEFAPSDKPPEQSRFKIELLIAWSVIGFGVLWMCFGWIIFQKRKD
jgi:hypothetical protein